MTASSPDRSAKTVLVVDDTQECVAALEIVLEALRGVVIRSANSAEEALLILAEDLVSVLITDIQLPHMDGLELVSRVRRDARHSSVSIVVISGDANPHAPQRALRAGADAFFTKPYSPLAVRRKLEELIDAK